MNPKNVNYDDSVAYEASAIVKATPGTIYRVDGYNSGSAQFIQLHDFATLPANDAVPAMIWAVAATTNFTIDLGEIGRWCEKGIVLSNSSTGPKKTIGSADCWFSAQYK